MATFVLVHGAWLGGWVWGRVAAELRARGHTVYTPTLTGLGARRHLLRRGVTLETHATDVYNLLEFEDLQRAILVGHGYGGAVAQRVAVRAPARVGRLVFLDAWLARDGTPLCETLAPRSVAAWAAREADEQGLRLLLPDLGLLLDGLPKRDADWVEDRLTPLPRAVIEEPVALDAWSERDPPVLYVRRVGGDPAVNEALAREYGWDARLIDAPYLLMLAKVEPTAELLDNFARQPAAGFTRAGRARSGG